MKEHDLSESEAIVMVCIHNSTLLTPMKTICLIQQANFYIVFLYKYDVLFKIYQTHGYQILFCIFAMEL